MSAQSDSFMTCDVTQTESMAAMLSSFYGGLASSSKSGEAGRCTKADVLQSLCTSAREHFQSSRQFIAIVYTSELLVSVCEDRDLFEQYAMFDATR